MFAGQPFLPNDPYYSLQWNLDKRSSDAVVDANVSAAWAKGWTGQGVRIGVIEAGPTAADALEWGTSLATLEADPMQMKTHPDLKPNYTSEYDFFERNQSKNVIFYPCHATAVAGIAAARGGNGVGVTGAAPYASLSSLSVNVAETYQSGQYYYDLPAYDGSLARAIGHRNDGIQIKTCSLVVSTQFARMPQITQSLQDIVSSSTIPVFCAGNLQYNANKYGDKNSSNEIVVSAVGSDGKYAVYTNYGANLTVSAPSSSSFDGSLGITTTDRVGAQGYNNGPDPAYTSDFEGTSAATPLVSGALALAKEAQPALNTRFAKHLLARTSVMVDPDDATLIRTLEVAALLSDPMAATPVGGWHTNAAGVHFNNLYGFGMIDAGAAGRWLRCRAGGRSRAGM